MAFDLDAIMSGLNRVPLREEGAARDGQIQKVLTENLGSVFESGERVAIKLHMGEPERGVWIDPNFVKIIADSLRDIGANPFLFDSTVIYSWGGRRSITDYKATALQNGFGACGCDIVISNTGRSYKTDHLDVIVCKPLLEADGVVNVAHLTGHPACGGGAVVKNYAMGGVTTETKRDMHFGARPVMREGAECQICYTCENACGTSYINIESGVLHYDADQPCWGCRSCIDACPYDILVPDKAEFATLLAESAVAVANAVKKSYYINWLFKMTKECDCLTQATMLEVPDMGIVMGNDMVNVDAASFGLLNNRAGRNILQDLSGKDPSDHVREADRLLGERQTGATTFLYLP